jgi:hypothetical protein
VLLAVSNAGPSEAKAAIVSSRIPIDYTMGYWNDTLPVEVEIGGPDVKSATLTLTRQPGQSGGIVFYAIELVPV